MGEKDLKITQDIKFLEIVQRALTAAPERGISITNIGTVQFGDTVTNEQNNGGRAVVEAQESGGQRAPRYPELPYVDMTEHLTERLEGVLMQLQGDKFTAVHKAMFKIALGKGTSYKEAADWLGVKYQFFIYWVKRLKLDDSKRTKL